MFNKINSFFLFITNFTDFHFKLFCYVVQQTFGFLKLFVLWWWLKPTRLRNHCTQIVLLIFNECRQMFRMMKLHSVDTNFSASFVGLNICGDFEIPNFGENT